MARRGLANKTFRPIICDSKGDHICCRRIICSKLPPSKTTFTFLAGDCTNTPFYTPRRATFPNPPFTTTLNSLLASDGVLTRPDFAFFPQIKRSDGVSDSGTLGLAGNLLLPPTVWSWLVYNFFFIAGCCGSLSGVLLAASHSAIL